MSFASDYANELNRYRAIAQKALKQSYQELASLMKEKYREMYRETVKEWYGDYSPLFYSRTGSLYDIFNFDYDEDQAYIGYDTELLHHPSLDETVFTIGYHGGAKHNGGIYWRTPHPYYTHWGREAASSPSPYYSAEDKMQEYEDTQMEEDFNNIFIKNLNNMLA